MKMLEGKMGRGLGTGGGSMVYVIFLVALLSIFSCAYMAASSYNVKAVVASRRYFEAQLTAKTIHTSFSEAVSSGDSPAMSCLWDLFNGDVELVREEYDRIMSGEDEVGEEMGMISDADIENIKAQDDFEQYLKQALDQKEYVINGVSTSGNEEDLAVEITLKAKPLEETAYVHTKVICNGYRFSMKADIVFDNSDGAVMKTGTDRRRTSSNGITVYLEGNGVYRYYEDDDYDSP